MDFSKWFKRRPKDLSSGEVLESLAALVARLDDLDQTIILHQQAWWRIEKKVAKYMGKDNGDQEEPSGPLETPTPAMRAGQPTKSVW